MQQDADSTPGAQPGVCGAVPVARVSGVNRMQFEGDSKNLEHHSPLIMAPVPACAFRSAGLPQFHRTLWSTVKFKL